MALNVLANLSPKDLMSCAQTCKAWRQLADDNLLWSQKCRNDRIEGNIELYYYFIKGRGLTLKIQGTINCCITPKMPYFRMSTSNKTKVLIKEAF